MIDCFKNWLIDKLLQRPIEGSATLILRTHTHTYSIGLSQCYRSEKNLHLALDALIGLANEDGDKIAKK